MKWDKESRLEASWDKVIDEELAQGEERDHVIYEVQKRTPKQIESITRDWIRFLSRLGYDKPKIKAMLAVIKRYRYSLAYMLKYRAITISDKDFEEILLDFHAYPWQRQILDDTRVHPTHHLCLYIGRGGGKTELCAVDAVISAYRSRGYPYIDLITSKSRETASIMFKRVSHYINTNPILFWCVNRSTLTEVELDTGAQILTKPAGFRGEHADKWHDDESAHYPDELHEATEPTIASKDGVMFLITTPNGKNNWVDRKWVNEDPRWIKYTYPSSANPRITPEWLEAKRKTVPDFWYRQEYLAERIDWSNTAFAPKEIDDMMAAENYVWHVIGREENEYYAGLDLGQAPDETVLIVGHEKNNHIVLDTYRDWSQIPYNEIVDYIHTQIAPRFNLKGIAVDAMGAGEGVITSFPPEHAYTIEPVRQSIQWHTSAYLDVKYYLETRTIHCPHQDKLNKQMKQLIMKTTEYGRRPIHPEGEHDDTYSALSLLIHTYLSPNTNNPMEVMKSKTHY
jgi:hypothetical protein